MGKIADVAKHSLLRTLSVICTLLVIGGLVEAVYLAFIKPHYKPIPTQKAEQIINNNYDYTEKEAMFLGIKLWKIRLGVSIK